MVNSSEDQLFDIAGSVRLKVVNVAGFCIESVCYYK